MSDNYYQLLHVLPDAPAPVIKASYRAMMQKLRHHPDLGGDPRYAQLLNEAVDTLCNPARRAIYDSKLQARKKTLEQETASPKDAPETSSTASDNDHTRNTDRSTSPGGRPDAGSENREPPGQQRDSEQQSATATPQAVLPTRPHCLFCQASFSAAPRARQHYQSDDLCHQCRAPAAPLEELSLSTTEELRRIYRHDHHASVKVWTHWPMTTPLDARLQDLSLAGCAIESITPLDSNATVLLDTEAFKAICQVRYCKPVNSNTGFSIGLAFKTLKIRARPGTMFSAVA